jgi:hypothetical protein
MQIACNVNNVSSIPLGTLNLKFKMEENFKIMFGIRGFNTHESLSSHTTFRPIKSGATVPLNAM